MYKKTLSTILIIAFIATSITIPKKTEAFLGIADFTFNFDAANFGQNTTTAAASGVSASKSVKDIVQFAWQKVLAQLAARVALNMSQQIINWGATGFKGDPFYVRDTSSFLKSIADEQVVSFINASVGGSKFGNEFAQSLITAYTSGSAPEFNLDQYINPEAFAADFTQGGWAGWLAINANPANNPYGYNLEASRDVASKIAQAVQNQKEELRVNGGFLSVKKCVEYGPVNTGSETFDTGYGSIGPDEWSYDDSVGHHGPFGDEASCNQDALTSPDWASLDPNVNPPVCHNDTGGSTSSGLSGYDAALALGEDPDQFFSGGQECKRWETTTPGSLVREQVNKAVLSPLETAIQKNTQGGIGDALISLAAGVITQGINNLVGNAINGDDTVGGQGVNSAYTGGTIVGGTYNWNTGPGSTAVLEDPADPGSPSAELTDGITFTEAELGYLKQARDLLATFPIKEQTLDICLPGPDKGWKTRLTSTFQVVTRKLSTKSQKDTNNGDAASDAIRRLSSDMDIEVAWINQSMVENNIPSAPLITDRINLSQKSYQEYTQIQDTIASKIRVLAVLNDIVDTINDNPSIMVDGVLTPPASQDLENLRRLYSSIQPQIGSADSRDEAQGNLALYQKDNKTSFDATNPDSLQSKCLTERGAHPELEMRDNTVANNRMLFCRFQEEVLVGAGQEVSLYNSGFLGVNNNTVTNPTNIDLYYPGEYTWDQEPYNNNKVDISCTDFYRGYLGDYSNDSFGN